MFVTLVYLALDVRNHEVQLVRSGHNAPYLYRAEKKSAVSVRPREIGIGLDREGNLFDEQLATQRFALAPGDVLVCYTDGISEAKDVSRLDDGDDRLVRTIKNYAESSAKALSDAILADVAPHRGQAGQSDDITQLVVRREK